VSARLAEIIWERGRMEQALEGLERSFSVLSQEEPDEDLAALAAQVGRFMFFGGNSELALDRIETALDLAEALLLPDVLSEALNTRGMIISQARGRRKEAISLVRYALEVALENDKPSAALRAYNNLGDMLMQDDRYEEAEQVFLEGVAFARKVGDRYWERILAAQLYPAFALGKWDELLSRVSELLAEGLSGVGRVAFSAFVCTAVAANVHRGRIEDAEAIAERVSELETSADLQERAVYAGAKSRLLLARGNAADASQVAEKGLGLRGAIAFASELLKETFGVALEAAFVLDDLGKLEALVAIVEDLPPGRSSPYLRAQAFRFGARVAARRGETDEAERRFRAAAALFREIPMPFYLAATQLEHGEWLSPQGRVTEVEAKLAEARELFEGLDAKPWLERLEKVPVGTPTEVPA
jgi:tetratricopeptide (TPR) repeat protein